MACWHCGKGLGAGVRICAFCGADQQTPGQKPKAARSLEQQREATPLTRRRVTMGGQARARWPWVVVAAVAVAVAASIVLLRPQKLDLDLLETANPDLPRPCSSEPRCLVVYVAPWAPTTEKVLATIQRLGDRWAGDVGLAVVVGRDDANVMEAFARDLSTPALLDPDDRFATALKVETSPTFVLVDRAGRVDRRVDGLYFPYEYHARKLGLDEP